MRVTPMLHERRSHRRAEKILLQHVLKNVSRSFYLSLSVLPGAMRKQLSLAYLFCRAADTIADTQLFPRCERLQTLQAFRRQFLQDRPSFDDLEQIKAAMLHSELRRKIINYFTICLIVSMCLRSSRRLTDDLYANSFSLLPTVWKWI